MVHLAKLRSYAVLKYPEVCDAQRRGNMNTIIYADA